MEFGAFTHTQLYFLADLQKWQKLFHKEASNINLNTNYSFLVSFYQNANTALIMNEVLYLKVASSHTNLQFYPYLALKYKNATGWKGNDIWNVHWSMQKDGNPPP